MDNSEKYNSYKIANYFKFMYKIKCYPSFSQVIFLMNQVVYH
jgi:hypothetical protein